MKRSIAVATCMVVGVGSWLLIGPAHADQTCETTPVGQVCVDHNYTQHFPPQTLVENGIELHNGSVLSGAFVGLASSTGGATPNDVVGGSVTAGGTGAELAAAQQLSPSPGTGVQAMIGPETVDVTQLTTGGTCLIELTLNSQGVLSEPCPANLVIPAVPLPNLP